MDGVIACPTAEVFRASRYGAGAPLEVDRPPSLVTKISKPRKYIVFPVSSSAVVAGQFVHLNDVEFAGSVGKVIAIPTLSALHAPGPGQLSHDAMMW